jgi:hypothetical protein
MYKTVKGAGVAINLQEESTSLALSQLTSLVGKAGIRQNSIS